MLGLWGGEAEETAGAQGERGGGKGGKKEKRREEKRLSGGGSIRALVGGNALFNGHKELSLTIIMVPP